MSTKTSFLRSTGSHEQAPQRQHLRLHLESLESRHLLTALFVDGNDTECNAENDRLYCEVQDAIDAANEYDTIVVAEGRYEPVVIRTNGLTVEAADGAEPVIANATRIGVQVRADGVTVSGLTVEQAGGDSFLVMGNGNTLQDNAANNGDGTGFRISNGNGNSLIGNFVEKPNAVGFHLEGANENR